LFAGRDFRIESDGGCPGFGLKGSSTPRQSPVQGGQAENSVETLSNDFSTLLTGVNAERISICIVSEPQCRTSKGGRFRVAPVAGNENKTRNKPSVRRSTLLVAAAARCCK